MVLADFLNETRKRWLTALKMLNNSKKRKVLASKNKVSPLSTNSENCWDSLTDSYNGTVDARGDITIERYNTKGKGNAYIDNIAKETSSSSGDSAYDSDQGSPAFVRYTTVTYLHVDVADDTSSITTEITLLDEHEQDNMLNEKIELFTSL